MDLLRVAARVASRRAAVPGGGGTMGVLKVLVENDRGESETEWKFDPSTATEADREEILENIKFILDRAMDPHWQQVLKSQPVASRRAAVPGGGGTMMEIQLDPATGSYNFEMNEVSKSDDEIVLQASGVTADGLPFKGVLKVFLENGEFSGWDWLPQEGNLPAEPEAVQPMLDSLENDYGL